MSAFNTVLSFAGRHRLYYRGWQLEANAAGKMTTVRPPTICVAESADGIAWERLPVNRFEYAGSRQNNIVWLGEGDDAFGTHGFAPFIDENPDCRPDERWKAFGAGWKHSPKGLHLMTSPDGIEWRLSPRPPLFAGYALDSHNTVRWNPSEGCYRAYFRHWDQGSYKGLRVIMTATSPDLETWNTTLPLEYAGEAPPEALYTNNVMPYPRAPHLLVGFPARYVERQWSPTMEALPELEHRRHRAAASLRYGTALSDTQFMAGRDGRRFHRWPEAFIRPGRRAQGSWAYGDIYLAWGMLETPSDQPGGGMELSFYATENYWRGSSSTIRRHTLRPDGFVSVRAPLAGGGVITRPLVFSGSRLLLNISTSAAGGGRVEIQDDAGCPLPGFSAADCWEIVGDTLEYQVQWRQGADISSLAGRPVRLRFELRDADLFSFRTAAQDYQSAQRVIALPC